MSQPDHTEVLKHLKTLIRVAMDSDDIGTVHKLLGEMKRIIEKVVPDGRKRKSR